MKLLFLLCAFCFASVAVLAQTTDTYPVHPDSQTKPGVPKGELLKFTLDSSTIFPGTWREYWVYVPAQYRPDQPACV